MLIASAKGLRAQCGAPDLDCATYTHDAEGNMLTKDLDEECDGAMDLCEAWTYGTRGEVLTHERRSSIDGVCDNQAECVA